MDNGCHASGLQNAEWSSRRFLLFFVKVGKRRTNDPNVGVFLQLGSTKFTFSAIEEKEADVGSVRDVFHQPEEFSTAGVEFLGASVQQLDGARVKTADGLGTPQASAMGQGQSRRPLSASQRDPSQGGRQVWCPLGPQGRTHTHPFRGNVGEAMNE